MDSLRHISLLREIGVDWYAPRIPLALEPSSLALVSISPAVKVAETALPAIAGASVALKPALRRVKPNIDFGLDEPKTKPAAKLVEAETKPVKSAPVVKMMVDSFNLLVVSSESLVFISDVKTNPLSAVWERSARQFFTEIQLACDQAANTTLSLDYFSWPLLGTSNVSLGEEQLSQLLNGFMRQRITGASKAVILFGDSAHRHASSLLSGNDSPVVIKAPALGKMFADSASKALLWKDLQTLNTDRG